MNLFLMMQWSNTLCQAVRLTLRDVTLHTRRPMANPENKNIFMTESKVMNVWTKYIFLRTYYSTPVISREHEKNHNKQSHIYNMQGKFL